VDTTNIYAQTDLVIKAKAPRHWRLAIQEADGRRKKRWRDDPNLMEFLRKR